MLATIWLMPVSPVAGVGSSVMYGSAALVSVRVPLVGEGASVVEDPPFTPDVFESLVASELEDFSYDEILHWLRHGQPDAGEAARLNAKAWTPAAPPGDRGPVPLIP